MRGHRRPCHSGNPPRGAAGPRAERGPGATPARAGLRGAERAPAPGTQETAPSGAPARPPRRAAPTRAGAAESAAEAPARPERPARPGPAVPPPDPRSRARPRAGPPSTPRSRTPSAGTSHRAPPTPPRPRPDAHSPPADAGAGPDPRYLLPPQVPGLGCGRWVRDEALGTLNNPLLPLFPPPQPVSVPKWRRPGPQYSGTSLAR